MIGTLGLWIIAVTPLWIDCVDANDKKAAKRPQQSIGIGSKRRKVNDDDDTDDAPMMVELPRRISHEDMAKIRNDASSNERIFETNINDNPPWPKHMQMNVSIHFNQEAGVYAYYARIFGTDEWTQIQHSGYIKKKIGSEDSFDVVLETPRYAVGFDCILLGEFYHSQTQRLQYFTSYVWQRPSTLSPIYTDEVIAIYDNGKPNLNVEYAEKANVSSMNPYEVEIGMKEPGVYGHYCRRKWEKEWKRSTNVPDRYYEAYAFESDDASYKLLIAPPKTEEWQYLLIGRADKDKMHLVTSKVITTLKSNDGCVSLLIGETAAMRDVYSNENRDS